MSRRLIRDEDLRLNLILDGKQIPRENKRLMSELGKLERQTMKLERAYDRLAKEKRDLLKLEKKESDPARAMRIRQLTMEMNTLNTTIRANHSQMKEMRQQIGLSGMTLNQLRTHLRLLKIEQSNLRGDRKTWKILQKEIKKTNFEIKRLALNASRFRMVWENIAAKANLYGAAISFIGLAFYGASRYLEYFTGDMKELEDTMGGVRRTTDLTAKEVWELKEAFDQMDTRTASSDLLEMAKVAGRLGVEGQANITGFVEAMDKINVALGEDLGGDGNIEDTAKAVGKLVKNFNITDDLPLNEALLRAGSVLNELDKSSQATAGGILEFTTRLSGLAGVTKVSLGDIAGIGAVLDAAGISAELSGTAVQRIMVEMGKNVDTFSKLMGMSAQEYKETVNTDLNAAFLQLLEMTNKGKIGITGLAETLGALGINQQRATTVLGILINQLDEVENQQTIANEAFKSSNSIMEEYAIMNENFSAQLEKQTKRVTAFRQEVGKELEPAVVGIVKVYADFLYLLHDGTEWVKEHAHWIKAAAIAYGAFAVNMMLAGKNAGILSKIIQPLLFQLNYRFGLLRETISKMPKSIRGLKLVIRSLWATMAANPLMLVVAAAGAVAAAFVLMNKKAIDGKKVLKEYDEEVESLRKNSSDLLTEETAKMNAMFELLKRNYADKQKRKQIVDKLNTSYGQYIKNLDAEKINLEGIEYVQEQANKALAKNIALKKQKADIEGIINAELKVEKAIQDELLNAIEKKSGAAQAGSALGDLYDILNMDVGSKSIAEFSKAYGISFQMALDAITSISDLRQKSTEDIKKTNVFYKEYLNYLTEEIGLVDNLNENENKGGGGGGGDGDGDGDDDDDKRKKRKEKLLKNLEQEYKEQQDMFANEYLKGNIESYEEYQDQLKFLEVAFLKYKKDRLKEAGFKTDEIESEILATRVDMHKETQDEVAEMIDESNKRVKESMDNGADETKDKMKDARKELRLFKKELQLLQAEHGDSFHGLLKQLNLINEKMALGGDIALDAAIKQEQVLNKMVDKMAGISNKFISIMHDFATDAEMTQKEFARRMILIALDTLQQELWIAIVRTQIKEIASKGFGGIITAAIYTAMYMAAFAGLKAKVSNSLSTNKTKQYSTGKYPVTGADDGRTYNAEYVGKPKTGLYSKPSLALFNENPTMPEIVVDGLTSRKIMFDYPTIYSAIRSVAEGGVPQLAEGQMPNVPGADAAQAANNARLEAMLSQMMMINSKLYSEIKNGLGFDWQKYEKGKDTMDNLKSRTSF